MKLGISHFKCNHCGTLSYPPQYSDRAEETLTEEYTYPVSPDDLKLGAEEEAYELARVIDCADVPGIPDDAGNDEMFHGVDLVEERKEKLEELKSDKPSEYGSIVRDARSEYGKWRSDRIKDVNADIDNREAELKNNAKSVSRTEQPHTITLEAERYPAEIVEENGEVTFRCPNCGKELARASKP